MFLDRPCGICIKEDNSYLKGFETDVAGIHFRVFSYKQKMTAVFLLRSFKNISGCSHLNVVFEMNTEK